jgi:hypothetical protein
LIESLIRTKVLNNKKNKVTLFLNLIKNIKNTLSGGTFGEGIQIRFTSLIQNASNRLIKIVCYFFSSNTINVNQLKQAINTVTQSGELSYDRLMAVYNQIGGSA